jgi:5-methylcytosine-specific restriction endonuclease McrA
MANARLRYCLTPHCTTKVEAGFCPTCRPTKAAQRFPTDPRYGTQQWRRYSQQRRHDHPFCALCGVLAAGSDGPRQPRGVTDHIVPVIEAPDRFWDETNHRTLCTRCNRQARADRDRRPHRVDTAGPAGRVAGGLC